MLTDFARRASDFSNFYPAKVKFQFRFPWDQSLSCLLNRARRSRRVKEDRQLTVIIGWILQDLGTRCEIKTKC